MAKEKKSFSCSACGAVFSKWSGQCQECGEWNTVSEQDRAPAGKQGRYGGYAGAVAEVQPMAHVRSESDYRFSTSMKEFDRVLGGGVVPGSVVLIGGDPGVGKSTCLLQVGCSLSMTKKVLYVTGEESPQQIAMRAKRLGLPDQKLLLLAETQVEHICATALQERPDVLIIDSIQTMQVAENLSAPGSVSQVRESAAHLTQFAKQTGIAIFLVGHVTKTGDIAGPRVLEHIIDVVCYLEGNSSRFRMMRAVKNRFGAVNELGVFAMTEKGLKEISNPSAIFLPRLEKPMPGSVVMVVWEGSRPLLVQIQALVDQSYADNPRRLAVGLGHNRLAMLLAVLHKHGGISTYNQDVFINIVGGVKVFETSVDLPLLLSVVSSIKDEPIPQDCVVFGEVGLSGEIRPVANGEERIREAAKHGFKHAVVPFGNAPKSVKGLSVTPVRTLDEALKIL